MTIPITSSALNLKDKDKKLKQAVQGFKLVNLGFNQAEIAMIAGVSKGTVHNKKETVETYWDEVSTTPNEDKTFIRKRSIELGIKEVLSEKEPSLERVGAS